MGKEAKDREIKDFVRRMYATAITSGSSCCCSPGGGCCTHSPAAQIITAGHYNADELAGLPQDLLLASFGCGNPFTEANLQPGETVLDLGSGAGLDALIAARYVGPSGKVYGLDMTEEMIQVARANRDRAGVTNIEFLQGEIENIPLPDNSVDVILSNCVINLSPAKDRVLQEAFRVLKPGGRLAIADIALTRPLPPQVKNDLSAWSSCIAGAVLVEEYRHSLETAGFVNCEIKIYRTYDFSSETAAGLLPHLSPEERAALNGAVVSVYIKGQKPRSKQ